MRELVEGMRKRLGEGDIRYASALAHLANLYISTGDYQSAEPILKSAVDVVHNNLGEAHSTYILALTNLACFYHKTRDYSRAEQLFLKAIDIERAMPKEERPEFVTRLLNLGKLYETMGRYREAEDLLLETVSLTQEQYGDTAVEYANALTHLANLYYVNGRYHEAEQFFLQSSEAMLGAVGENHRHYLTTRQNLLNLRKAKSLEERKLSSHRDMDADLAEALFKLIRVAFAPQITTQSELCERMEDASYAVELVAAWPSLWVSRAITFLAKSFFLMDPIGAGELYGGMDKIQEFLRSETVENYFVRGYSRIFRGERELVLPTFRAAAELEPNDPYVLFSLFIGLKIDKASKQEIARARERLEHIHPRHPLGRYIAKLV
jgi:tetratricopeptide (TPR) repeat protein